MSSPPAAPVSMVRQFARRVARASENLLFQHPEGSRRVLGLLVGSGR